MGKIKKVTLLLLGLLVLQPLIIFLLQGVLVTTVPVHFGWTPDMWNVHSNSNLKIAMVESAVTPALILAFRALPGDLFIPATRQWIFSPKTTWLWWLFGMNWFVLLSLFSFAPWISWSWQIWTLFCGLQLLAYIVDQVRLNHRTTKPRRH